MVERVLLVDFENVQGVDLKKLPGDVRVRLVLGAKQTKLPTEIVLQAQAMGERFAYVPIKSQQANGVDFCVAFYLGEYLTKNPKAECIVLSKDKKGFDPLVAHLTGERGFRVRRVDAQEDAFAVTAKPQPVKDNYSRMVELLGKEKSRPLKLAGLEGKIKCYFPKMSVAEHRALLERLIAERKVSDVGGKVSYAL